MPPSSKGPGFRKKGASMSQSNLVGLARCLVPAAGSDPSSASLAGVYAPYLIADLQASDLTPRDRELAVLVLGLSTLNSLVLPTLLQKGGLLSQTTREQAVTIVVNEGAGCLRADLVHQLFQNRVCAISQETKTALLEKISGESPYLHSSPTWQELLRTDREALIHFLQEDSQI